MQVQNVQFTHGKETKNTYRYEAPTDSALIQGSIYLAKSMVGPNPPDVITVSVSTEVERTKV